MFVGRIRTNIILSEICSNLRLFLCSPEYFIFKNNNAILLHPQCTNKFKFHISCTLVLPGRVIHTDLVEMQNGE